MRSLGARRRGRGFTLLEVMIALSILAVGLLAILMAQLYAQRGGQSARHSTQAAMIARDQMEFLHQLAWADPALVDTAGFTAPIQLSTVVATSTTTETEQLYNISWRITDVNPDLKALDVDVTWDEPSWANRAYAVSSQRHNDPVLP